MTYLVSIFAHPLACVGEWRLLVAEPRPFPTLRAARTWVALMRPTWTDPGVLLPTEDGVVAFVVDESVEPVLAIEMGTDPDTPAVERDRDELRDMQKTPRRTR